VLLIDGDLRRPTVHHAFGFDNIVGSRMRWRRRRAAPARGGDFACLSVVPAGRPSADPMEALTSSRMLKILDEAASVFD
jgi:Mrp family chromosome partitioning ATPase